MEEIENIDLIDKVIYIDKKIFIIDRCKKKIYCKLLLFFMND